jgi:hypothetical protein
MTAVRPVSTVKVPQVRLMLSHQHQHRLDAFGLRMKSGRASLFFCLCLPPEQDGAIGASLIRPKSPPPFSLSPSIHFSYPSTFPPLFLCTYLSNLSTFLISSSFLSFFFLLSLSLFLIHSLNSQWAASRSLTLSSSPPSRSVRVTPIRLREFYPSLMIYVAYTRLKFSLPSIHSIHLTIEQ